MMFFFNRKASYSINAIKNDVELLKRRIEAIEALLMSKDETRAALKKITSSRI
jgi:prefoldin subunit 5